MVSVGSDAQREVEDMKLTRYVCCLVVQNADARKRVVALGQTYFTIQTRRQEEADQIELMDEDERIPPETVQVLARHRDESCYAAPSVCVFFTGNGTLILLRNLNLHFSQALEEHQLRHISIQDLRHTHATLLFAAGEQIRVVSDRLGHSTLSITMSVYAHSLPGQQQAAASRIASILSSPGDISNSEGGKNMEE